MSMITPSEIVQKCSRRYPDYLRALLQEDTFFPLQFPAGSIPDDFVARRDGIADLRSQSKEALGYGYRITFVQKDMRLSGLQTIPTQILIETEHDYLRLL